MKKIVYIAVLLFVAASCQKEDIRPNVQSIQNSTEKGVSGDGTETNPESTDPNEEGNDITDPMRKKDKKGTK
jgi:hypothetical protein